MMHSKRPSEVERAWIDRKGDPINVDRAYAESDRQMNLSRRAQALLAAAGESGPVMQWFVLCIAHHAEKDVDKSLGQAGVERWFPVEKRLRNAPHAKRKVVYHVPALPGYVFVKVLNRDETWAALLTLEGVRAVLGGASGPVPVAECKYLELKKKLDEKSTDEAVVEAAFPVGARVRIEDGPFASFGGSIEKLVDGQRAIVLVEIFGRLAPTELGLAQITKSE
ncbi:transcriptional antiterminator NusG [Mesorhizobium sp. M0915]|uniref:transcription termination/antitermination protein NusG n=1 Tax=Mesorhizobium sp. M0915 TaxID=2957027 RepID=UPI003334EDB0